MLSAPSLTDFGRDLGRGRGCREDREAESKGVDSDLERKRRFLIRKSVNCKAIFPMEKLSNNVEQSKKEYADFMDKVKRTVLLDNLSHEVTATVIKSALEQYGNVINVEFVPNFAIPYDIPQSALVEMEDALQASKVIKTMRGYPFMISGMPRPARAQPATDMFADRPPLPGRKLQLEEEVKLAKQQEEMVQSNYKKYEMIELLLQDGIPGKLARHYGMNLSEE
ncbi:hypothetical protein HPP92_001929 [Vanilla planifolia]|uniref:RRM domain-containing protein n=1 Tax=Vanilla planifolia TaxID=51239 RepID=A0A835S4F5_VANPL|nr:hypothetical protein HPP92_001929 [Vanilla planifolia]